MLFESIPSELILLIVLQCAYQQAARLSCTNSNIRRIVWPEAERMRTDHRVRLTQAAAAIRGRCYSAACRIEATIEATASCGATLNLSFCSVSGKDVTAVAEGLRGNRVLTELRLGWNGIGDEGAKALASALRVNGVLTHLWLNHNNIGDEGAKALASALRVNAVLTELRLGANAIGDEGATALASALEVNGVLKELNLWSNSIGPTGATALADALRVNGVLTNLDLSDNNIGGETDYIKASEVEGESKEVGAKVVYQGREMVVSVGVDSDGELRLRDSTGVLAIAKALEVNGVLTSLDVSFNRLGDEGKGAIRDAVSGREGFKLEM